MKLATDAFIALVAQCSVGDVPVELVSAVAKQESIYHVYALSGSYDQKGFSKLPKTESEIADAYAVASESIKRNINVSLGLMQINSYHIDRMKYTPDVVFDPCFNVAIGTSLLSESLDRMCGCTYSPSCVIKTLREYNTGNTVSAAGKDYARKVLGHLPNARKFFSKLPQSRTSKRCVRSTGS